MSQIQTSAKEVENTSMRNISTTRGNKRQAVGSPPVSPNAEDIVTRANIREIIEDVLKTELSRALSDFDDRMKVLLNKELQPINDKISGMEASLNFMNNQYEDLLKEHATSTEAVRELQKENSEMKTTMSSLKTRLEQLEQQTRSNNVEIQCLPEKKQENLFNIVSELSKTVGCSIENKDILHCTRVAKLNPENRPRSIIVQLASPRIRDQLLASVINFNKSNRDNKLNSMHLGFAGPKTSIYVTEHLSPTYKSLHASARLKAKELGYKFVCSWWKNLYA
ncbi:uncharacterized protein LOC135117574 [Helicoverpa armigera]|uniref:uncharacterized protein LOC135117574 n=1 Tax=Helicoverpa armigera TaxID=29058 RepID=UPI00308371F6